MELRLVVGCVAPNPFSLLVPTVYQNRQVTARSLAVKVVEFVPVAQLSSSRPRLRFASSLDRTWSSPWRPRRSSAAPGLVWCCTVHPARGLVRTRSKDCKTLQGMFGCQKKLYERQLIVMSRSQAFPCLSALGRYYASKCASKLSAVHGYSQY